VALRRGVPVPALLQSDVRIPLEFRRVQAANLSQWSPGRASPEFDQLFVAVHATDTGNGRVVSEGSYNVLLLRDAPGRVVLSTQVSVPNGDSRTPGAHMHAVNLVFEQPPGGGRQFRRNCMAAGRPDMCWE